MFRDIDDLAVAAGAPATPYLMRAIRDNTNAIGFATEAIGTALDETVGHDHSDSETTTDHAFVDRIIVKTGVNDRIPFRFASSSPNYSAANYSSTLAASALSPTAHAAAVQLAMRTSVGGGSHASVPISVTYDMTEGSETRGLFLIQHTGSLDSPNARVLELHFETGTGAATGNGPSMGFPKHDRKKAYGYHGDSGFADGITEVSYTREQGGLLTSAAWVAGAFTTAKFADQVVPGRAFQAGSVGGSAGSNNIHLNAATGSKVGPPVTAAAQNHGTGASHNYGLTMTQAGAGRRPTVCAFSTDAFVAMSDIEIATATFSSGSLWSVSITNKGATTDLKPTAY